MSAPGVTSEIIEHSPSGFAAPSTANAMVVGYTEKGPTDEPQLVTSKAHFVSLFGGRVAYGYVYDAVEAFFEEGGAVIYVQRLVGPTPVSATANIFDAAGSTAPGDVALVATAKSPGDWANSLNVEVVASGGNFTIAVSHDDDGVLETSPSLADRAEAVTWFANNSDYITLALGASAEDPRTQGPTGLASGDDDRGNVTETEIEAAWEKFTKDYGPGQVGMPGFTSDAAHEAVLAHAHAFRRIPHLDLVDTATAATLITAADGLRDTAGHRFTGVFDRWATVPADAAGTTKTIPYSAIQMGMTGHSEGSGKTVGDPVAGANGISKWAVGLAQPEWSEADRELLADAGVNVARVMGGAVRTYDYVTLANQISDPNWVPLNGARVICAIAHEAEQVGENHVLKKIDGRKKTINDFIGDVIGICKRYFEADDLFGETPEDAFTVTDTNTPETIAENKLRCGISAATAGFGRYVEIEITKEAS